MRLDRKVAIVTGAGSGFGEGIARRYAEEGAKVVVNDIRENAARRVAADIRAAGGEARGDRDFALHGGRARPRQHPRQRREPRDRRDGPPGDVHGSARHAGKPRALHRLHSDGAALEAARRGQRGALPRLRRRGVRERCVPGSRRRALRMSTLQTVGKYQLLKELGRGASAKVYLAEDPFAKRKVAIKVAFPEALKSAEDGAFYKSMFLNEAALAGKLNHPHIVQIYDAVVEDKYSYIVMEYVEGGTLEKFCKPDALLETREVAEISFKCVRALAFAQTLGLTHRDIKPGNILHSDGTEIKIADFGASINRVSDRTVITNVGSPAYMAPELVTGGAQASHLTDIYALGVVMYYLLAGKLPFSGANTLSVIYQIVNTDPEPPSAHREGISPELDAIVMKAMEKDAAKRYANWDEFGAALAEI